MAVNKKKTICVIGPFPPPLHGQSAAVKSLVESPLLRAKYDIVKVDYAYKWSTCKILTNLFKIVKYWKMIRDLRKVVNQYKIDIFYLTISSSNQGAIRDWLITKTIAKRLDHAKFIIHHHGGNFRTFYESADDKHRKLVGYYLQKVDRAIVLTPKLKSLFNGLLPDEKVRVISNGICLSERLSDGVIGDKIAQLKKRKTLNLLFLSVMVRTKGFLELLKSAPHLLEENVDFQMTFAGLFRNITDEYTFRSFVKNNKLEKNVTFKGFVDGEEKQQLLSESDIFVLPTSYPNEGQPISILEAMAAGMAVVTTDHGGITDVVKDGVNGIILPSTTPAAIANAILQLNNDRESLIKICKENRMTAKEKYMEEHYVQNMIDVFDEVVKIHND